MAHPARRMLFALIFLTCAIAVGITIYRDTHPPVHRYTLPHAQALTEAVAISYTRQALADEGKSVLEMVPVPYWPEPQFVDNPDGERLFARNTVNPNHGYVIWSNGYSVRIQHDGDAVLCKVFTMK